MVDAVLLVVDATEGPMSQTKVSAGCSALRSAISLHGAHIIRGTRSL